MSTGLFENKAKALINSIRELKIEIGKVNTAYHPYGHTAWMMLHNLEYFIPDYSKRIFTKDYESILKSIEIASNAISARIQETISDIQNCRWYEPNKKKELRLARDTYFKVYQMYVRALNEMPRLLDTPE